MSYTNGKDAYCCWPLLLLRSCSGKFGLPPHNQIAATQTVLCWISKHTHVHGLISNCVVFTKPPLICSSFLSAFRTKCVPLQSLLHLSQTNRQSFLGTNSHLTDFDRFNRLSRQLYLGNYRSFHWSIRSISRPCLIWSELVFPLLAFTCIRE